MEKIFEDIISLRKHFPLTDKKTYLMSASTGIVADYVYEAYKRYQTDRFLTGGDSAWGENNEPTPVMLLKARENIGQMINAPAKNIAFGDNSSRMLNLFVNGISLKETDNVIIPQGSFVSIPMAWKEKSKKDGFEIRSVPSVGGKVSFEDITGMADENTRVLNICGVENNTGFRHDIKRLGRFCRENGIFFLVDGMQMTGVLETDVEKMSIDFLYGGDYKWMMGFCGTGFAYISDRCLDLLSRQGAGWFGAADRFGSHCGDIPLSVNADRFEYGYPNAPGIYSLGLVAKRCCEMGCGNIERYVMSLADKLREMIKNSANMRLMYDFGKNECSQIVKIITSYTDGDFPSYLEKNNVSVNCDYENGVWTMRASVHYANNISDIERFVHFADNYNSVK